MSRFPATTRQLDDAEHLLDSAPVRVTALFLEVYQHTFDARVASLIERLGALHLSPLSGLPAKQAERAAALSTLLHESDALSRSAVLDAIANFARSAQGQKVWPVLDVLLELPADPRIATMAFRLLEGDEVRDLTGKVLRRVLSCVERHGHVGQVPAFEAWAQSRGKLHAAPTRLANLVMRVKKRATPQLEQPVLSRLLTRVPEPLRPSLPEASVVTEAEMLGAIAARPDDDAPRLMYADWLTERLDPRGEFIALQVARATSRVSKQARTREDELYTQHRARLLGPLERYVTLAGLRFERGFLVRCALAADLPRHPLIRLLRDVEFGQHSAPRDVTLDSLTTARALSLELLPEYMQRAPLLVNTAAWLRGRRLPEWTMTRELLARLPRPLERLEISLYREPVSLDFVLRGCFALPTLARLSELAVSHSTARDLPTQATLAQAPESLRTLTLFVSVAAPGNLNGSSSVALKLERETPGPWVDAKVKLGWRAHGDKVWPWLLAVGCQRVEVRTGSPVPVQALLATVPQLSARVVDTG